MSSPSSTNELNNTDKTINKELHGTTNIVESDDSESNQDVSEPDEPDEQFDNDISVSENNETIVEIKTNDSDTGNTTEMETIDISCGDSDEEIVEEVVQEIVQDSDEEVDEIKHLQKDADRDQMIKVYCLFIIEIFKVAMASFLALSVIQNCEGEVCSYSENIKRNSKYGNFVISINVINVIGFAILYFFEFNREMFLIEYLDIDKRKGDYHLPKVLGEYLPIKNRLVKYNKVYYLATRSVLLLTAVNWVLSGILIFDSFHSFKTITSFATNILLVITKLSDSYGVSKQSYINNYGLSAYIKEYTSFNVIDKDHVRTEEE
jgi:hypothetical protein